MVSLEDSKKEYKREYAKLRYYLNKKKITNKEYSLMLGNIQKKYNINTTSNVIVQELKDKYL